MRRRPIALMNIANISDLADKSSYVGVASELASPLTGLPNRAVELKINRHNRRQSVWALIEKAAKQAKPR